ncbi:MAG: iron ABC transporter permease [Gemmatimonadetes bacterium]|nr:iron ABC transporter permease [Gemmatimonadota bacterium]
MTQWRRAHEALLLSAPPALLALIVLVPVGTLAAELALAEGALALMGGVLGSAGTWALLGASTALAAAVTGVSGAIGVPLGILLGRTDVRWRGWLLVLHALPVFVPPFLVALGWFHVLGVNGYAGSPATARLFFSPIGLVAILAVTFAPIVTTLTALALQNVDASLEDAARVVARPLRVMGRILLPAVSPAIALGLLVVFALAFSELAVPMFLRVRTYPASVFARLGGIDYEPGEAVAMTLPLLAVTFALLAVERRFVGDRTFAVLGLRGRERATFPLGRWRAGITLMCIAVTALSLIPVLALFMRALPDGLAALPQWIRSSLWNSLITAMAAATTIIVLGLAAAWTIARGHQAGRALDATLMLGFLTPAGVLGVGLITAWNHQMTRFIYGGLAILVLGLIARYAVVGVRVMATAIAQSPRSLEEAAAVFGGGRIAQLRRIVAPLHVRGITAAWLLTLVFCLRDLDTVVLFYPPGREPLTVRIFTLEANGPSDVVAALAVTQIVVTTALLGVLAAAATVDRTRTS